MIDIHSHVIPFVDDGSNSLEDSMSMIDDSLKAGVKTIICTPHHIFRRYQKSVEEIKTNFELLNNKVKELNLDIHLLLGQEIFYTKHEDVIALLKQGRLLTVNNTNYVLLEFDYTNKEEDISEVLYNFSINGYKVIVAHVERYKWISTDIVKEMRHEGALIQVNSNSVVGLNGFSTKRFVKRLLKENLVDFIASDMHSFRRTTLKKASSLISSQKLVNNDIF